MSAALAPEPNVTLPLLGTFQLCHERGRGGSLTEKVFIRVGLVRYRKANAVVHLLLVFPLSLLCHTYCEVFYPTYL